MVVRAPQKAASRTVPPLPLIYVAGWLVPGLAHLWLGRRNTGVVVCAAIVAMFVIGLSLDGRLFPFVLSEPLVALAALADVAVGLPNLLARLLGAGAGVSSAVSYEYGNTFLITAGLLNMLVIVDAHDIALGRK